MHSGRKCHPQESAAASAQVVRAVLVAAESPPLGLARRAHRLVVSGATGRPSRAEKSLLARLLFLPLNLSYSSHLPPSHLPVSRLPPSHLPVSRLPLSRFSHTPLPLPHALRKRLGRSGMPSCYLSTVPPRRWDVPSPPSASLPLPPSQVFNFANISTCRRTQCRTVAYTTSSLQVRRFVTLL